MGMCYTTLSQDELRGGASVANDRASWHTHSGGITPVLLCLRALAALPLLFTSAV